MKIVTTGKEQGFLVTPAKERLESLLACLIHLPGDSEISLHAQDLKDIVEYILDSKKTGYNNVF